MELTGQVACMEEVRNVHKICLNNLKKKTTWETYKDNIKLGVTEIAWESVDCFGIPQGRNH